MTSILTATLYGDDYRPAQPRHSHAGERSIIYTPSVGYVGADTFTYTIADGKGGVATATVSVTVTDGSAPSRAVYLPLISR